jgi:hypothetical protein
MRAALVATIAALSACGGRVGDDAAQPLDSTSPDLAIDTYIPTDAAAIVDSGPRDTYVPPVSCEEFRSAFMSAPLGECGRRVACTVDQSAIAVRLIECAVAWCRESTESPSCGTIRIDVEGKCGMTVSLSFSDDDPLENRERFGACIGQFLGRDTEWPCIRENRHFAIAPSCEASEVDP